jgi:hypothetical protein
MRWHVNQDPEKLNVVFDEILGGVAGSRTRGRSVLDEQTKARHHHTSRGSYTSYCYYYLSLSLD